MIYINKPPTLPHLLYQCYIDFPFPRCPLNQGTPSYHYTIRPPPQLPPPPTHTHTQTYTHTRARAYNTCSHAQNTPTANILDKLN